jgi:hypothetical protein
MAGLYADPGFIFSSKCRKNALTPRAPAARRCPEEAEMTLAAPLYCPRLDAATLDATLRAWQAAPPPAVLALLPETELTRLGDLQAFCAARGIALRGALFPRLVVDAKFSDAGAWLLPFATAPAGFLLDALPKDADAAARAIADAVEARLPGDAATPSTLFMIFDAMVPNIASILEALYLRLADRVAYAGVNAGSETFQPMPCLFDAERLVGDGVLCLLLPGAAGAALDHGYAAPPEIITATATQGNRVMSIDWRPAFEVYQEQVRDLYDVTLTRENFYEYAIHFPFGILLANNEFIVRIPVALETDGSLFCVGEVPENAMMVLLRAPRVDSARSVGRISEILRDGFGGLGDRHLLTFYCAGRRLHLGDAADAELARLAEANGGARLAGALSLGEIGSLGQWGYPQFHNATLVCRPWD